MYSIVVVKYAYTFSSRGNMPKDLLKSIKSLKSYTDPSNIVVFYTPPRKDTHKEFLDSLGVDVRLRDHWGEPFKMGREDEPSHYKDKLWICELEDDDVIFLDCDTVVLGDPCILLEGDFDFRAREDEYNLENSGWSELFDRFGKDQNWMPNAGVMVFKNGVLKKSRQELEMFLGHHYDELSVDTWHLEQYAFSLAMSRYSIERMDETEHAFGWEDETPAEAIVYHLGGRRHIAPKRALVNNLKFKIRQLFGLEQIDVF
jgi:hypothetical protein